MDSHRTELLGLEAEAACEANHWRIGGCWEMPGRPRHGYHGIERRWLEELHAVGPALLIGEGPVGKAHVERDVPALAPVTTAGLDPEAELAWDLCLPGPVERFETIVAQAVLEHVLDPVAALRHLLAALTPGGLLVVHTNAPAFPEHHYPIDVWRFMPQALGEIGRYLGAEVVDLLWTPFHAFAVYRRPRV